MQRRLIRLSCLLAFHILSFSLSAQDRTDQNWWMGNSANGIQFSQPDDIARITTRPTTDITGYGDAGGAVASDPSSGALLFYSDGVDVFDRTHRPMPGGALLQGSKSGNQSAVVARVPGSMNRYFILSNTATATTPGAVFYHEVDIDQFGNSLFPGPPLGDVTIRDQATGVVNASEGMILVPNNARDGYWLITHLPASATFHVTEFLATGEGATTDYTPAVPFTFTASHIAYDSVSMKLAVAPVEANRNITTYDFNNVTGEITFDDVIFNSAFTGALAPGDYALYDVAWSNTGEYLYASRQNLLLQFDMANTNVSPDTVTEVFQSYGLQLAPDSSIYHIYQAAAGGPFLVGRITNPDTVASEAGYEPLPFGAIDFRARQFPSFLPDTELNLTVDFDFVGSCQNAPVSFFPTVTPGADSLRWNFGDAANGTSGQWAPVYTYSESGTFNVTVTAYLAGDSAFITKPVNVTAFDIQLTLVQDTTACSCELTFPENPPPSPPVYSDGSPCNAFEVTATAQGTPSQIQWYGPGGALAGQTSLTLTPVDSAGYYYVIAGDGSGCAASAGVNIKEYGAEDQRANIWLFGQQGGIDFNDVDAGPRAFQSTFSSNEGTAVISDQNGQVIVSTNGEEAFDRLGNSVGTLGGSQDATQSALIIPFPSDPTLYYIFVTQEVYPTAPDNYELRYAVFDLKIGLYGGLKPMNGAGDVFSKVLFTKNTERITGNANWLIAHEYGNNNFRAYPLTAQGIGNPVISSIGSDHSLAIAEHARGYMELGANGVLAVALSTPGVSNVVEIFDFIDSTGTVTNFRTIDLQQADGQVYGLEFSPGNQKLFVSTSGSTSMLHEFAYDSVAGTYVDAFAPINPGAEIGAIQVGPNGTIYVATNGSASLSSITPNEDPDVASTFTLNDFPLNGGTSTLGLPNFIQNLNNFVNAPGIVVSNSCEDQEVIFTGNGTDPIDTLTWQIRDAANTLLHSERGVNLTEIVYTFDDPGQYTIRLIISNRCVGLINTIDSLITIHRVPTLQADDAILCNAASDTQLTAVDPADPEIGEFTFLWI
ncbi:MAG TPA: PKD domain-containing protein, partial [Chryseosolibacter sp.]|nr:PKD domain-containing protein [Chryseosolibacter sp.]